MRTPYRTMRHRLSRRAVAFGRRLPTRARHRLRRTIDQLARLRSRRSNPLGTPEIVTAFDHWATQQAIADTLVATLTGAGLEVVRLQRNERITLAVAKQNRDAALTALAGDPTTRAWFATDGSGRPRPLGAITPSGDNLRVFRWLAAPDGTLLSDAACGVQLQFWRTAGAKAVRRDGGDYPSGTRLAPGPTWVAPYLTPDLWQEAQTDPARRLRPQAPPHLLTLTEPVDIVYTWVDDADPAWQRRRASVQPSAALAADALHTGRTWNRDELRYSLRSVAMYAGWFRHIWLVTDGQVPEWLADHPRLTVVPHSAIFSDPAALPTFNSHAIESQLHHIDGLAEHFLYLNDDVFFGRPVRPDQFFAGPGIARFSPAPIAIDRQLEPHRLNGAMLAARNNREFLESTLGRTVTHRMRHTPHAHLRSSLAALEAAHPDLVARVARSRFRAANDLSIASDLGHYWAFAHGQAVTNGLSKIFQSMALIDAGPLRADDNSVTAAAKNNRTMLENDFGRTITNKLWHTPKPHSRALMTDFEGRHPELFDTVMRSRFRSGSDYSLASTLYAYYAFANHQAVTSRLRYGYLDLGSDAPWTTLEQWLRHRNLHCLCVNDGTVNPSARAQASAALAEFLEAYFPLPSRWERS